eukprot:CAMPEP_0178412934 /NCGR_PEP_ID=MMETSP0689_2-20121128/22270_1 /TAXON_ID=160604 /ORGANISM="Amphidinium massartii, Strain CS-259" /LENGTH=50 /DNA_ID=CAMNT_0020034195 /DNA_START=199 /DNA_END=351 /DNA_ORIENTATION=+
MWQTIWSHHEARLEDGQPFEALLREDALHFFLLAQVSAPRILAGPTAAEK